MAEVTVSQLAESIDTPVDRLLQQMKEAGLPHASATDAVSDEDKQTLLEHRRAAHGEEGKPRKITLKKRTLSTLRTTGGGTRGSSRTVNVEVRKKRIFVQPETDGDSQADETVDSPREADALEEVVEPEVVEEEVTAEPTISAEEVARRQVVMAEAEAEAERRRQESIAKAAEEAAQKEKEEREKEAEEAKKKAQAARTASDETESRVSSRKDKRDRHDLDEKDTSEKRSKHGNRRRRVQQLVAEDLLDENASGKTLGLSSMRRKRATARAPGQHHKFNAPTEEMKREVEIGENISVAQLSQRMAVKATEVIKVLMGLGVMANINQTIDQDTAMLVVEEFGHNVKILESDAIEKSLMEDTELEGEAEARSPVVTVMGHVDHGKTSLLDYIRKTQVADGEAGGITQHIGAYRVNTEHGEICFIDTPGHAAFTAMRARGAQCTDIVILVVAADDGLMPQTEEAIQHAKAAGVPLVVAVNKIDLEGADPDRVKNELAAKDVIPDDWGGDTQFINVSALTGQGINELLEAVLLQSELLELTAVPEGSARGIVIESELDKGKGSVVTLLVQNGQLSRGDIVVAGENYGRARALTDAGGQAVKLAGPATPVVMLGLNGTPAAGDPFQVTEDEKRAREVAEFRRERADEERLAMPATSLDNLLQSFGEKDVSFLNIVVKADVRGSLEAIVSALEELGNEEVKVNVVFKGVGGITESDVDFAITAKAVIFGFNVRADSAARKTIESEGLDLRYYKVIYDLVDDVKAALSGMLSPEVREEIVGIAQVRDIFDSKKWGKIAGCMVTEGTIYKEKRIRVLRDNIVIYEGELESLRHFKDEVEEMRNGTECGIGVRNYNDVRVGDQIEVFDSREVARAL
ncbi:MAG: translation initiation factor IF-2 [Gammaproteobacteria bacterium]|nr:translation initiation factor IF-2 [Gammaproteobacteria bacterium]MAV28151.1 translation initiation factor IF-2 [Gammaproteobacteria bacterium]RPG23092.1 MAG: translation initiation factor IF-2 [Gammaproteobacteria bacterium TMED50]|tara:strand:- start:20078 stop:22678 length:2601 start_codon:yes stop_codon:yes gene_type:complete